jgi:hypothetical protein
MKIEVFFDANGFPLLSASVLKRARKHLRWRVADLSAKTGCAVAVSTINSFESDPARHLRPLTNRELVSTLQGAGIVFVPRRSRADLADAHAA